MDNILFVECERASPPKTSGSAGKVETERNLAVPLSELVPLYHCKSRLDREWLVSAPPMRALEQTFPAGLSNSLKVNCRAHWLYGKACQIVPPDGTPLAVLDKKEIAV